jgi:hypothetical protein
VSAHGTSSENGASGAASAPPSAVPPVLELELELASSEQPANNASAGQDMARATKKELERMRGTSVLPTTVALKARAL